MNKTQLIQIVTPIMVPLILALVKMVLPKIPKRTLPIFAPFIGAIIDVLSTGTIGAGTAWGAALGSAGVGVREVWDQWWGDEAAKRKADTTTPPAPPTGG